MGRYFADSFYWIALLYRRDTRHAEVTAFSQALTRHDVLFTTDAVLTEFLAAMSAAGPYMRQRAADRVDEILSDRRHHVIEMTRGRFLEGLALYRLSDSNREILGVKELLHLSQCLVGNSHQTFL